MNKKIFVLAAALLVSASTGLFAFGIGLQLQGNANSLSQGGAALTAKFDSIPLYFTLPYSFTSKTVELDADYWLFDKPITKVADGSLNWFLGVGFFVQASFADSFDPSAGLRIPLGLDLRFAQNVIELFAQVTPSFGIYFYPELGAGNVFFPLAAGFRLWFK